MCGLFNCVWPSFHRSHGRQTHLTSKHICAPVKVSIKQDTFKVDNNKLSSVKKNRKLNSWTKIILLGNLMPRRQHDNNHINTHGCDWWTAMWLMN